MIDAVRAYVEPASPLYAAAEPALACLARLTDAARRAAAPVVFTKVVYQAGGADGGFFCRKVPGLRAFDDGSPLGQFPPELQPRPDDLVVVKQYASAFFGTSLAATLRFWGIDTVILGGFSTSGCVRATATDAIQNGFVPFVVKDACADRHAFPHEANLFDLQAKYAEVVNEEEIVALLQRS